jgi:ubiquinone/menaquinone biosynthesis C-methylase UbiE
MTVYESKCPLTKKLFMDRIKAAIDFSHIENNTILLDVGVNTGQLLKTIRASNNLCECWGIDIEPGIKTLQIKNCKLQVADVQNLPFADNYFDVVFALDVLEHVRQADVGIKEIHRVLKPNGLAILSGPTESWFYKLCRFIQFGVITKNIKRDKHGFSGEVDYHFHTVYELEDKFLKDGFKKIKEKSLPGKLLPTLFRITVFQK